MEVQTILILSTVFALLSGFLIAFTLIFNKRTLAHKSKIENLKNEQGKKMLNATIETQEIERNRIGSNIHDDIGPMLSLLKLKLNKIDLSGQNIKRSKKQIDILKLNIDETIQHVRNISKDLMPTILYEIGLDEALDHLIDQLIDLTKSKVHYDRIISLNHLTQVKKIAIYRIIQESCNNVLKHANAKNIYIDIVSAGKNLELSIRDDGVGFDLSKKNYGLGLINMKARATALDSTLEIKSITSDGTSINVQMPINNGTEN